MRRNKVAKVKLWLISLVQTIYLSDKNNRKDKSLDFF